jgi:CRISPR-associated protein Cmr4
MIASLFTITAQSNLHPGSGDANYGIIDKLVQRDPLTDLPVIHASSLKGAILQHFFKQDQAIVTNDYIDKVFGGQLSESKRRGGTKRTGSKTGEFIFMQANLLSIPARSNERAFFRVSGSGIISALRQHLLDIHILDENDAFAVCLNNVAEESKENAIVLEKSLVGKHHLEDLRNVECKLSTANENLSDLKKLLGGDNVIILPDEMLRQLTDNHHLPVIARNHLENGQSTNLWYEQVLPRQTRFAFTLLRPEQVGVATDFDSRLTDEGLVQIGANASVGYGYCSIANFQIA